ncbi:MAG TPA: DUF5808 domain-containing protein [Thermoanaerobaculia bacterium]|jgi:uncharacterized membrane protein|nr:DUF5808 domain-containing protein [Thermoanaerobaculia bacterium]
MIALDLALTGAVVLLLLFLGWRMPGLTRPELFFAVTVPSSFPSGPEGKAIVRRYRSWIAVHAVLGLALAVLAGRLWPGGALAGLAWQSVGWFVAFLLARRQARPHAVAPTTLREAALTPRHQGSSGGWLLQLLPFAALAATGLYLQARWTDLPPRFAVHWRLDGQIDRWSTRGFRGVFGPLVVAAAVVASLALLGWAMPRFSRRVRASGPAAEAERRFRRAVGGVLLATEYLLVAVVAWTGLLPLAGDRRAPPLDRLVVVPLIAVAVFVCAITWILVRLGQGGSRLRRPKAVEPEAAAVPVGDRSSDDRWKAGVFYFDPADPALFAEKRFGVGYTLNLARPVAWLIVAAVLLLPALLWWLGLGK